MDPLDIMDMRKPPSRFQRWVKQPASTAWNWTKTTGPSFVIDGIPDLYNWADRRLADSWGMHSVSDDKRAWYNRRQWSDPNDNTPWWDTRSPGFKEEGWSYVFDPKRMAQDAGHGLNQGLFLATGPVGGARAMAARALKGPWRQTLGAGGSWVVNRAYPYSAMKHGIETGEFAPAVADALSYGGAVGSARLVGALNPRSGSHLNRFLTGSFDPSKTAYNNIVTRAMTGSAGQLVGALAGGLGSYTATRPFANLFGGDATDIPIISGVRRGDYVFDSKGNLVFDPPLGKYPEWDALYRRG